MDTERIKEIQKDTAYPDSRSVQQALIRVWHETNIVTVKKSDLRKLVEEMRSDGAEHFTVWHWSNKLERLIGGQDERP